MCTDPKSTLRLSSSNRGCESSRTYERTPGTHGWGSLNLSRAFYGEPSRPVTLKTNEETWESLDESESYVKTGDPVREIVHEDEDRSGS